MTSKQALSPELPPLAPALKELTMDLPTKIREVYAQATCPYTRAQVETAIDKMAQMSNKLADTNPIFLCLVVGGIVPLGNLLPRLDFPLEVDYVHVTRYQQFEQAAGSIQWKAEPTRSLKNRTVVIVDDILDGGLTLSAAVDCCRSKGANAVYTAVLVDKKHVREQGGIEQADFTGLIVNDHYVFGYGINYKISTQCAGDFCGCTGT